MKKSLILLLLLLFVDIVPAPGLHANEGPLYQIIVNAKNPIDSVDRRFIADTYLKKVTRWPEDGAIQPVDLRPDSLIRRRFSEDVLDRSVMGVKIYWQQLIFSGRDLPPPELATEEEVVQYVGKTPGSIGYVSSSFLSGSPASGNVKVVSLR